MHISDEKMDDLVNAYILKIILNDAQLEVKRHMADCDYCYERFCKKYVIKNVLCNNRLYNVEKKRIDFLLSIKKSIDSFERITVQKAEECIEDLRWNFKLNMQPALRSGNETIEYISNISENTKIIYDEDIIKIILDPEFFGAEEYKIQIIDVRNGECLKQIDRFEFDEDMELFYLEINCREYPESIVINII